MNLPGIFGLHAALGYLEEIGIDAIRQREQTLARRLWDGLAEIAGAALVGTGNSRESAPIVSVDFPGRDNAELAFLLAEEHGILTRCGLHCVPHAHKTLGTFSQGTVRFSLSHFNSETEVDTCIEAVKILLA